MCFYWHYPRLRLAAYWMRGERNKKFSGFEWLHLNNSHRDRMSHWSGLLFSLHPCAVKSIFSTKKRLKKNENENHSNLINKCIHTQKKSVWRSSVASRVDKTDVSIIIQFSLSNIKEINREKRRRRNWWSESEHEMWIDNDDVRLISNARQFRVGVDDTMEQRRAWRWAVSGC